MSNFEKKRLTDQDMEEHEESKRQKRHHDQCFQIFKAVENLHQALKPRYVRLDELIKNRGLQHLARSIFWYLDYSSLASCRLVSKSCKDFIDNHCDQLFEVWKVLLQTLNICKNAQFTVENFYMSDLEDDEYLDWSLEENHPDFMVVFDYFSDKGSLPNLKTFTKFMVEYCDAMRAYMNERKPYFDSPLHYAAEKKRFDIFDIVARSPLENINIENCHAGHSLLGGACKKGQLEVIRYFINLQIQGTKKIDFNTSHLRHSLFHVACLSKHSDVVKLFLKYRDVLPMDLNSRGDGLNPFFKCVLFGKSFEVLEMLLEDDRIDVNATDSQGSTALIYMYGGSGSWSHNRDEETVLQIIDLLQKSPRIDVNLADIKGRTPFHFACQHGKSGNDGRRAELFLKMALERGNIDVNQRDKKGRTPTHFAFHWERGWFNTIQPPFTLKKFSATIEVILKFVKDLGIDLNATDNEGKTPLHYLYSSRNASHVSQFLEAAQNEYGISFDSNIVDLYGQTPIHYANNN